MKSSTLIAPYKTDLELALYWIKNNNLLRSTSEIQKLDNKYIVRVRHKGSKQSLTALVKDRFGVFVEVI